MIEFKKKLNMGYNMDSKDLKSYIKEYEDKIIEFAQNLIRIRSYSDEEEKLANYIKEKMEQLEYDEVFIDEVGNVVGRIGCGDKIILFDSHMDTVEVNDEDKWNAPPFSGEIVDGKLYVRCSVDMKSSIAASIFSAKIAKDMNLVEGKTIYVTCSVCEEFCDGVNIKLLFENHNLKPDYVVICEPSNNIITLGHKGKAQILIKTYGISAHGSAPEKGVNAVYEMTDIIKRVEKRNEELMSLKNPHGTLVLSDISCITASLNAVPSECSIYLDRRLVLGEAEDDIKKEMDNLIKDKNATWEIGTLRRTSWTGHELCYEPFRMPWKIDEGHELTKICNKAYESTFGFLPREYEYWDFGTNAVTPVSLGIPTIGFGPGDYKLAHMLNENCEVIKIIEACNFYVEIIRNAL